MKKLVMVLIAILLMFGCITGVAQGYYTLTDIREQATNGWHKSYFDKYGREITVDIDIEVFGQDAAPVLKCVWPDYIEYDYDKNNPYLSVTNVKRYGGQRTVAFFSEGERLNLDQAYGMNYGNNLTLREAYNILKKHLECEGITTDEYVYEQPDVLSVLCNTSQTTGEVLSEAFYEGTLWPTLRELPLLAHIGTSFVKRKEPVLIPRMSFCVQSEDAFTINVLNLIEGEIIVEDIPLCSVEQVIRNLEKEIEDGYIQDVISLRFGYSLYNDPVTQSEKRVSAYDVECFYAVPSWVVGCKFMDDPEKNAEDNHSPDYITINAQTGKVPDYFDKSLYGKADTTYKGFISWEDLN